MKAAVTILDTNLEVEYDFKITAHGCPERGPSYSSGGEPAEPAEFELEVLGIETVAGMDLELPKWLKDLLTEHLYEREDINEIVQRADSEQYDPDDERI
jgi:hypothetical protein